MIETFFSLPARYDFDETLRFQQVGPGDPTARRSRNEFSKAARTPEGPATVHLVRITGQPRVDACAWGPGAAWLVEHVPALLGLHDEPRRFTPAGVLAPLARRHSGLHLSRTLWPWDAVLATILQQRVRFTEAARAYARLTRKLAEPAPGPAGVSNAGGLLLPPDPERIAAVPLGFWVSIGVEPRRVETILRTARHGATIDALIDTPFERVRQRLAGFRGCGPWTVETVLGLRMGDADAAPPGDVHLPRMVGWALTGEPDSDDARMLELLEPYRPHRYRVIRILFAEGVTVPSPRAKRHGSGWARSRGW